MLEPEKTCEMCGAAFHRMNGLDRASFMKRRFCSRICSNKRPNSSRFGKGFTPWNKGKTCPQLILSAESRAKKSESLKAVGAGKWRKGMVPWNKGIRLPHLSGENSPAWKGGVTLRTRGLRWSQEYKAWRRQVFERDNFTCQFCGQVGGRLNADHIKPLVHNPDLIFDLSNGRTLCEPCHRKTDTYGTKALAWKDTNAIV